MTHLKQLEQRHLREDGVCRKLTLHVQQKAQPTETKPPTAPKSLGHSLQIPPLAASKCTDVQNVQQSRKCCSIPRGTATTSSHPLSSALQRAEPQPPLPCPTSQAPVTPRRVEKVSLSPAVPRNCLHEDRTVPGCPQLPKERSIFTVGPFSASQPLAKLKLVNPRAAFQGQSSAGGPVPCPMHDF